MALPNGVLVHGPHSWACAIRHEDGRIEVASARKRLQASRIESPLLRGPARLAEALLLLPQIKAKLPAAKLPMENSRTLGSMLGAAVFVRVLRESKLRPIPQGAAVVARLHRARGDGVALGRARRVSRRGAHLDR